MAYLVHMKAILISLITCCALALSAQQSDSTQVIVMVDGSSYVGHVQSEDASQIILRNEAFGALTLSKVNIDTIYWTPSDNIQLKSEEIVTEDFWFEPPIRSINFLTETALPLEQGEMYYQNILLFGQKIGYGVTDHFTINAGMEFYTVLYDRGPPSLLIAPKYTFTEQTSSVQFAIGSNIVLPNNNGGYDFGGTTYGVVTFGNTNHNLSIGSGMAFSEEGIYKYPIFQVSGQTRIGRSLSLVFDSLSGNYDYDYDEFINISSIMLRFMNRKLIFDLGGVFSFDESFIIPMANFAIRI